MIIIGDCIEKLRELPDESVHCVVTSPPYWGLRDYGVEGQLGLEKTPKEYIAKMVEVFREVRRVMRKDSTLWVNIGDSLFNKNLVGIPWMLAFALRDELGFYLRSDIIWFKNNCMPESVTDRPTKAHEYVFLFAKSKQYYYDVDAIREEHQSMSDLQRRKKTDNKGDYEARADLCRDRKDYFHPAGRNKRSVWTVSTKPFKGAHFATFPKELIQPCIRAGTSLKGCCPECGNPMVRVTEKNGGNWQKRKESGCPMRYGLESSKGTANNRMGEVESITISWKPTCEHNFEPVPCTVLDPFFGAGTVGVVCVEEDRDFIGIELNSEYALMAEERIQNVKDKYGLLNK